ncbi:site-specific DNA-methyltransferase (adenine-specific) [Methanolinea mesophila]|uniref:DNA-methyltransferase n=1 Tax=Methanolinea mesophila TaxID=547055 RepID=UPI001AE9B3C4|nr:DNA methyltransferase [Methanolinea mesophila]MBP1928556.1 site-specific DNA-methyltransferase (adenine-specific) [Methanolinea mesophila]
MNPGRTSRTRGKGVADLPAGLSRESENLGPFERDRIYQGDALELLSRVPEGSVDLIITDPPFAIDFRAQRLNYNRTGGHVLEGYREIPAENYAAFTRDWVGLAYRALAPSGSMYLFSGWNRLKDVLSALDDTGFITMNHLIWKYQFGVFTRNRFVTSHYHILFAVKNPKNYTFHKIDHYPEDVWVINREYWKGKKKTPTKLPSALVKKILAYSSNPGDTVLDPFLGSGTVAVASQEEGRHFLGFEIVPEYFDFALERLGHSMGPPPGTG